MSTSSEFTRRDGLLYRNDRGILRLVPSCLVPDDVKAIHSATMAATNPSWCERASASDPLTAAEVEFIEGAYVRGSLPRLFEVDGRRLTWRPFIIEFSRRFGWEHLGLKIATIYRRIDQVLINAGYRVREFRERASTGRLSYGSATLPQELIGLALDSGSLN